MVQGIKSFLASQVRFQAVVGARTYGTDSPAITCQPTYIYMHVCIFYVNIFVHVNEHFTVTMYVCIYAMYACLYICMYVYAYLYVCMNVCMYFQIQMVCDRVYAFLCVRAFACVLACACVPNVSCN